MYNIRDSEIHKFIIPKLSFAFRMALIHLALEFDVH